MPVTSRIGVPVTKHGPRDASAAHVASNETASAQGTTNGSLRGTIKDKNGGEAAIGATVVATSPALQGEQVVITDETGQYFITSLPPGMYTLTVYYSDATFSRGSSGRSQ